MLVDSVHYFGERPGCAKVKSSQNDHDNQSCVEQRAIVLVTRREHQRTKPVIALVSGSSRLDEKRLGAAAGEPVAKADAEMARTATGYAIGGVPPFGHATEVPVFMDRDLLGHTTVWAAAGRPDSVFEIAPERLRELSRATVLDLRV